MSIPRRHAHARAASNIDNFIELIFEAVYFNISEVMWQPILFNFFQDQSKPPIMIDPSKKFPVEKLTRFQHNGYNITKEFGDYILEKLKSTLGQGVAVKVIAGVIELKGYREGDRIYDYLQM